MFIIQQGFAPTESFEVAKADMIVDGLDDLMDKLVKFHREKNEETKVMFGMEGDKSNWFVF